MVSRAWAGSPSSGRPAGRGLCGHPVPRACTVNVRMEWLTGGDRTLAQAISRLAYCNPFLPERIAYERQALGGDFVPGGTLWHASGDPEPPPNVHALRQRAEVLSERLSARLTQGARPSAEDLQLYEDVVVYLLFTRYADDFYGLIDERGTPAAAGVYRKFRRDVERLLQIRRVTVIADREVPHLFAASSRSAARSTTSSTTSSAARHPASGCGPRSGSRSSRTTCGAIGARSISAMGDVATLITGPSGTGKELVARAIGTGALHPVRRRAGAALRASAAAELVLPAQPLGAVADADRVRAVRPPPRRLHRRGRGPRRAGSRSARRSAPCSSTRSASSSPRSR